VSDGQTIKVLYMEIEQEGLAALVAAFCIELGKKVVEKYYKTAHEVKKKNKKKTKKKRNLNGIKH